MMNTCKRLRAVSMPIASAIAGRSLSARMARPWRAVQQVVEQPQAIANSSPDQQAEVGRVAACQPNS
jgi:hypothetical protein